MSSDVFANHLEARAGEALRQLVETARDKEIADRNLAAKAVVSDGLAAAAAAVDAEDDDDEEEPEVSPT